MRVPRERFSAELPDLIRAVPDEGSASGGPVPAAADALGSGGGGGLDKVGPAFGGVLRWI